MGTEHKMKRKYAHKVEKERDEEGQKNSVKRKRA
jgi:hypothetical protein